MHTLSSKTAEIRRIQVRRRVDEFNLSNMKWDARQNPVAPEMIYTLTASFLAAKHGDTEVKETLSFPLTWWDHLKQDLLVKWPSLSRFIKTVQCFNRNVTLTQEYNLCPHVEIHNDESTHLKWLAGIRNSEEVAYFER